MSKFFINRPIVAMVISIVMVFVGALTILTLPIAQFPNITPPEIQILATYVGADAQTLEQVGGHSHRAADEWRGQHELHVFAERNRQLDYQPDCGLRRKD